MDFDIDFSSELFQKLHAELVSENYSYEQLLAYAVMKTIHLKRTFEMVEGVRVETISLLKDAIKETEKRIDNYEVIVFESGMDYRKRKVASAGANALHNKAGGSRENRKIIIAAWASGKYKSRDMCAEQEASALGISFSTARRALRNTPDPK